MRVAVLAAFALAGCFEATEIVVTVDTAFGVPCTIDALHVEATSSSGTVTTDITLTATDLPGSITLTPDGHRGTVAVTVVGMRAGEPFATAQATVDYDRNVGQELRFILDRSCVPGPCPAVGVGSYDGLPDKLEKRACGEGGYAQGPTLFAMRDACDMRQPVMGTVLANSDEEEASLFDALPFPIAFYGRRATSVWAGSNGYLAFSDSAPGALVSAIGSARPLGPGSFPAAGILPFWDDLQTGAKGICYAVSGESPDRLLWVTWHDACFAATGTSCGTSATQGSLTFGLAIEETTDKIYLGYPSMVSTTDRSKGLTATIGVTDLCSGATCNFTQVSAQQASILTAVELVPQ